MDERTNIPSSPACGEWETQLADALDGLLGPEDAAKFVAHKIVCPACAALDDEARKGRQWLEFLSSEPEVPAGLLEKILAATGPNHPAEHDWTARPLPAGAVPGFVPPVWQQPGFFARLRGAFEPRLMMTAAMAFFSIALTLNMTGVRLENMHVGSLRLPDLRPKVLRAYMERQLATASVPIVRYYDHLRFVYEVESRVRELRGQPEGENSNEPQQKQAQPDNPGQTLQNPHRAPVDPAANRDQQNKGTKEQVRHQPAEPQPFAFQVAALAQENGLAPKKFFKLQTGERSTPWIV
jgi:hypothetical protein